MVAALVEPAKQMRQAHHHVQELGFAAGSCDTITPHDAAGLDLGDETLKKVAPERVGAIRSSATAD